LDVTAAGGRYILKPEGSRFSSVPQNEQLWISPKVLQHSNERKCLSAGTCS
jgi:hypothetical protein